MDTKAKRRTRRINDSVNGEDSSQPTKYIFCPFYRYERENDEKINLFCEGGNLVFPDKISRREYAYSMCADGIGWLDCPIARMLLKHYDRIKE